MVKYGRIYRQVLRFSLLELCQFVKSPHKNYILAYYLLKFAKDTFKITDFPQFSMQEVSPSNVSLNPTLFPSVFYLSNSLYSHYSNFELLKLQNANLIHREIITSTSIYVDYLHARKFRGNECLKATAEELANNSSV